MLQVFPRQYLDLLDGGWTAARASDEVWHQWEGCLQPGKGQRWKSGEAELTFLMLSLV